MPLPPYCPQNYASMPKLNNEGITLWIHSHTCNHAHVCALGYNEII